MELLAEVAKTNLESVKAAPQAMDVLKTLLRREDDSNGGDPK
jgi:hypothetical protein